MLYGKVPNQGFGCLHPQCMREDQSPVAMVTLPNEILLSVLGLLREPFAYALSACVNRQWRDVSKSACPDRLIIDWQNVDEDDFDYIDGLIDWMCDKLRRGQLSSLRDLTLAVAPVDERREAELRVRSIKTLMKLLPLYSCTFDSYNVLEDVYKFLPDSIREVRDNSDQFLGEYLEAPLSQPCFRHITAVHMANLHLDDTHQWFWSSPPICLQRLIVTNFFDTVLMSWTDLP